MTREEIREIIFRFNKPFPNIFGIINNNKHYLYLKNSIINETNYLPTNCKISERIYHIIYNIYEKPKCKFCKVNETKFINFKKGYSTYCSNKCSSNCLKNQIKEKNINTYRNKKEEILQKTKQTNLQRYGVEDPNQLDKVKEKIKQTNLKRYGVEYTHQNSNILEKTKQTNLQRYGVEYPFQLDEVKNKIKQTNLQRYGVEYSQQNTEIKKKSINTLLKKYNVDNPSYLISDELLFDKKEEFKKFLFKVVKCMGFELLDEYKNNKENYRWRCSKCNNIFIENWRNMCRGYKCPICFPRNIKSKQEQEICDVLKHFNITFIENSRDIINPYEIDIFIPDQNIGIEFNGIYWHSEEAGTPIKYHLNKTKLCEEKGIRLIHIFEDEWVFKQDIVINRLKQILNIRNSILRIHARNCIIKEIDSTIKNEFLNRYHLQGKDSSKIKLGAFYNNELVSVMTFSHGNISKGSKKQKGILELNRFCTNYNYHIPGVASKMLTYFKRNYYWDEIFSYADKRWSNGNLYYKLGFTYLYDTKPNYWYIKNNQRIHRFNLRKRKDEPNNINEYTLRLKEGYLRVWDCGSMKFSLKNI